jgi:RNA polymerase sigma-70 factor (ECF subfamily)
MQASRVAADTYGRSAAARWRVSNSAFAAAIEAAVAHRFREALPAQEDVESFIAGLHLDDLALACACAEGQPDAWDHFVKTYRPELYRAARGMTTEVEARDLADSLYAELYGLPGRDDRRRSLLAYYHGRSKLTTWLRSVLAQRHVDRLRAERRTTSLDDDSRLPIDPPAPPTRHDAFSSGRAQTVSAAITEGMRALESADRLRLAYYYVHGLTLAEIGRLLGEHEATASRKLDKARKRLRAGIEAAMRQRGLDPASVDDWGAVARHDWTGQVADLLDTSAVQADAPGPFKGETP